MSVIFFLVKYINGTFFMPLFAFDESAIFFTEVFKRLELNKFSSLKFSFLYLNTHTLVCVDKNAW